MKVALIEEKVLAALAAWEAPGVAVAIVRGDEVVYLKGHGVKVLGKPEPITPDTLFPIASTRKPSPALPLPCWWRMAR